ncbi:DUF6249 domain-containing protein [Phenylobacterium sp.]|jgi:hypothetical protein|uniref:DUF6249 domain-containing protein n=1 Tax=Phenylobacterium sp. TaxID=1871053 RepID=UPI0008AC6276|nr:DUF6249 domain-containing protein [Phenylobacterium sp.]MBC7167533.1 hypothetical protein [Phenylobacterium sp.]OHB35417.1 MAG: hypothetical protein A2882_02615 [Phenylobacterium sp. RIFCSPHIGHO2_01_FULL_70_10]
MDVAIAGIFSGVLHTAIVFSAIVAIIVVPRWLKARERDNLHRTIQLAYEKGQTLPPELVEALTQDVKVKPKPSPERDLRTGVIWLGIAVGLAAFGYAIGFEEPDATYVLMGVAAFPGFIGLAFVIMSFIGRNRS